jgi:hypothetical protein
MSTENILRLGQPSWLAKAASWLAERSHLAADARQVAAMEPRELRDLGFSHSAAAESDIMISECGGIHQRSWIHAEPRFPRRAIRRN